MQATGKTNSQWSIICLSFESLSFKAAMDKLGVSMPQFFRLMRSAGLSDCLTESRTEIDAALLERWIENHPHIMAAIKDFNSCKAGDLAET